MNYNKRCKHCNKEYIALSDKSMYCSRHCVNASHKRIKPEKVFQCRICQMVFSSNGNRSVYCSKVCASIAANEKAKICNAKNENKQVKLRFDILNRDRFTCQYCGRSPRKHTGVVLHVDHVIPKAKGGLSIASNLVTSCEQCNIGKSDELIHIGE